MNLVRGGIYYLSSGDTDDNGTGGIYWSTAAYSSSRSRYFDFRSVSFSPQIDNSKGYGFSVRCIAHQWHFREIIKIQELISSTSPSVIVENAPLNFVRAGAYYWSDGQLYGRGTYGDYWSTTAGSSANSRDFYAYATYFSPQDNGNKGSAFSVRCCSTSPSVIVENAPLNFVRSGYYEWSDGHLGNNGIYGYHWSTTAVEYTRARNFIFVSSYFYPQDYNRKGNGFSVR